MIGGRSALLSAAGGGSPYGNWTGNYSDVSLLLRNGSLLLLAPIDESPTPKTIATTGGSGFTTDIFKYGSSSLRLLGSPDVLSVPKLGLISTDFTIEFWIYLLDGGVANQVICTTYNAPTQLNTFIVSRSSPGNIILFQDPFGVKSASTALPLATWTHIACVYIHSTRNYRIFVNGIGSTSATGTAITAEAANFFIGGSPGDNFVGSWYLNARIDDFRITKLARYTSNFTPPSAELPSDATGDASYSSVSLLLRNGNPLNIIRTEPEDESPTPKELAIVGSARISTTVVKYGNDALVAGDSPSFSWGASRLQIAPSLAFAYGTGDYTVEAWIYPTGLGNNTFNQGSIMFAQLTGGVNYFICAYRPGSTSSFVKFSHTWATSGVGVTAYSPDIPRNQWSHVAVVRSNGQVKVYGNGVSGSPVSNTQDFTNTTYPVLVGTAGTTTSQFEGCIDDLRVTKGVARYTKNFLPPPAELPAI